MENSKIIKISVRDLIELVLRGGDLVSSFAGNSRNVEAIKAHQKVQKNSKENYKSEVTIAYKFIKDDLEIDIKGRIDGVITRDADIIIDEIKTTTNSLDNIKEDYNFLHWAQVNCYAYFYCLEHKLDTIFTRLSYYQMDSGEIKYFTKQYSKTDLQQFFYEIIDKFVYLAKVQSKFRNLRDMSIEKLGFPYDSFREGQREFSVAVYRTIMENKILFAKAPTGIGKTMATIFPALKALKAGFTSKIFYTTAKTTTANEAKKALEILQSRGLYLKTIFITAKEKICFQDETNCDPEVCKYAKGHYNRINDAILDILNNNLITKEVIEIYAKKHTVCPFEFALDLTNWCDCVVCDYNYVFDPRVYLRRFFMDDGGDYVLLVDEAHNLLNRSREMYSAELQKKEILNLKNLTKGNLKSIHKALNSANSIMVKMKKQCEDSPNKVVTQKKPPKEILAPLKKFLQEAEKYFASGEESEINDNILDLYFKVNAFTRTFEYFDEKYITYLEKDYEDIKVKIFCVDPSTRLHECLKKVKTTVFFSATLTPMDYFMRLLGGDETSYRINFKSPFSRDNLCLLLDDTISTKYHDRKYSYDKIAEIIKKSIGEKTGNYIAFFPSYDYMEKVIDLFHRDNERIIIQHRNMSDEDRNKFIKAFSEDNSETLIGFAVIGGAFSEGLDLAGEKLSGVIIIGVGLPKICLENDIIKDHFGENNGDGFLYSYVYPGINKVLQASGRVIRTENDRGFVLLIDSRFSNKVYRQLMPEEWNNLKRINIPYENLNDAIHEFWVKSNKIPSA